MKASQAVLKVVGQKDLPDFKEFVASLFMLEKKFLLRNDIVIAFNEYCESNGKNKKFMHDSSIARLVRKVQELFFHEDHVVVMHREAAGKYRLFMLRKDCGEVTDISVKQYLDLKDHLILNRYPDRNHLRLDYMPFYDYSPSMKSMSKTGSGIKFLNKYLSSRIFNNPSDWHEKLYQFLRMHSHNGRQLLVNRDIIKDSSKLYDSAQKAVTMLETKNADTPVNSLDSKLRILGFERGWGKNAGRIKENLELLIDLISEPSDDLLGRFISRVPMPLISRIAIISPHGWFGQEGVLGKPDTGGQVIYILDQVRALEEYLENEIEECGLDIKPNIIILTRLIPEAENTTCWMRKEKVFGTDNCHILRIPFVDKDHNIMRNWISRFHLWPYLERFTDYAERELSAEFQGRPDLIVGNYSDGNLVATLLSDRLDVVQCTIAHALEKTKYLFSDSYWKDMKESYNFDLQFTADILAMNKADFIVTSSQQEISGTEYSMGQYESYQFFTLPDLYQIVNGINLYAPKFNIISPGVDEDIYFPFYEEDKRTSASTEYWIDRLFHRDDDDLVGEINDADKIPLFTMARLDRIKNITGLVEAFGMSSYLREHCNLIVAAGVTSADLSNDEEEREQIHKMYELIDSYGLNDSFRWLPSISKIDTGEVYRIFADKRGIFIQPALFEAFGLTIVEAMQSGLPTAATKFGGPLEIIEDGKSGAHINTSSPSVMSYDLEAFIKELIENKNRWKEISDASLKRVRENYTWGLYSEKMITLSKIYGFWRYSIAGQGKVKMDLYSDLIYNLIFKKRAQELED